MIKFPELGLKSAVIWFGLQAAQGSGSEATWKSWTRFLASQKRNPDTVFTCPWLGVISGLSPQPGARKSFCIWGITTSVQKLHCFCWEMNAFSFLGLNSLKKQWLNLC